MPVDAVPKVVAIAKAADGSSAATPAPAIAPAAPVALPIFVERAASVSKCRTVSENRLISMRNSATDLPNSLGELANRFTYCSTGSITTETARCRCPNSCTLPR